MKTNKTNNGFTLIEILVVVVILAFAMFMAVPMFSNGAQMQLQSAANMVVADLEYAKSMAISHQQQYGIILKTSTEYDVVDQNGTPVSHPVNIGAQYKVDFHSQAIGLNQINTITANFDTTDTTKIYFNYLGSPYKDAGGASPLNAQGKITLKSGAATLNVYVEPVTGYIHQ